MTLLLLLSCAGSEDVEYTDLRHDWPEPPVGGVQYQMPDLEIPAYTDLMACYFGTYEGEDIGIDWVETLQDSDYGHHVILLGTSADPVEYPDGAVIDCSSEDQLDMDDLSPLFIPASGEGELGHMDLPDGMAIKFKTGARWILQSHYINPTDTAFLTSDAVNVGFVAADDVETWVAPFVNNVMAVDLPAGEETTTSMECEFDKEVSVLFLLGHMHEWGSYFRLDWMHADGTEEMIYEVPEWRVDYRDDPPVTTYDLDAFTIQPGDRFRTTCTWDNDSDEDLGFPGEMCTATGLVYPQTVPLMCNDGSTG